MSDWAPTTDDVKWDYQALAELAGKPYSESGPEFDRWFATHDCGSYARGYRDGGSDERAVRVEAYKERLIEAATESVEDMLDRIATGSDHGARDIAEAVLAHALAAHDA